MTNDESTCLLFVGDAEQLVQYNADQRIDNIYYVPYSEIDIQTARGIEGSTEI